MSESVTSSSTLLQWKNPLIDWFSLIRKTYLFDSNKSPVTIPLPENVILSEKDIYAPAPIAPPLPSHLREFVDTYPFGFISYEIKKKKIESFMEKTTKYFSKLVNDIHFNLTTKRFCLIFAGTQKSSIQSPFYFCGISLISDVTMWLSQQLNIPSNAIFISFGDSLCENNRTLLSYGIKPYSHITVAILEGDHELKTDDIKIDHGESLFSIEILEKIQEKGKEISEKADMITLDTDEKQRFVMPCGHVISPDSLYSYCESVLNDGKYIIHCPHVNASDNNKCNAIWHWPVIRYFLGDYNKRSCGKLESKFGFAVLRQKFDLQTCECGCYLVRDLKDTTSGYKAICFLCKSQQLKFIFNFSTILNAFSRTKLKEKQKKPVKEEEQQQLKEEEKKLQRVIGEFCWGCRTIWKDTNSVSCGNDNCNSKVREDILIILREWAKKAIGSVQNVPSIRACPKCGQLIEHREACKHMKCSKCKERFCFVCMKTRINNKWQCGSSSAVCPVAPVQTSQNLPRSATATLIA